jgi:hypothetical protein
LFAEALETRQMLAVFTVTNTNDSGGGSLRQAILSANADTNLDADTINFAIPGSPVISPLSALPALSRLKSVAGTLLINGASQDVVNPGSGKPVISGLLAGVGATGLLISGTGVTAQGLVINAFSDHGVFITGDVNAVRGSYIGTNAAGTTDVGNALNGIIITGVGNTIGGTTAADRNVISGNDFAGINVFSANNLIQGNYIGLNAAGSVVIKNEVVGITIQTGGGTNNTIGGTATGAGNVISGNGNTNEGGITIANGAPDGTLIQGNFIGTDATGYLPRGNTGPGIRVFSGAGATIGGTSAAARNIIAGNTVDGIHVDSGATNSLIQGNYVGLDKDGRSLGPAVAAFWRADATTTDEINGINGTLQNGATFGPGLIGQAFQFPENVINAQVALLGSASGPLNITGSELTLEAWVFQTDASQSNNPWNVQVIAAKWFDGAEKGYLFSVDNGLPHLNIVTSTGRTDLSASAPIPLNTWVHLAGTYDGTTMRLFQNGLQIASVSKSGGILSSSNILTIGNNGTASGWKGQIDELAIYTRAADVAEIKDIFNSGTAGKARQMGNGNEGIEIVGGVGTTIGGTAAGAGNVIGANRSGSGIWIHNGGINVNAAILIQGNRIGTDPTGMAPRPNRYSGLTISDGANNVTVGGATSGAGNLISGNNYYGIYVAAHATATPSINTLIQGNTIGLATDGITSLANQYNGIAVINSSNTTIGGSTILARNVVTGQGSYAAINLKGSGSHHNLITGNYVGLTADGTAQRVGDQGIYLNQGAHDNTIGGLTSTPGTGLGNVVSGFYDGILLVDPNTNNNLIQGNIVGTNAAGTAALGPILYSGIALVVGPSNNTIGGTAAGARNLISGARDQGVWIGDANSTATSKPTANLVQGNWIGTDITGLKPLPNGVGVQLFNTATSNTIGGDTAAARNVISGNNSHGINITGINSNGNLIQGNYIGLDKDGNSHGSAQVWYKAENNGTDLIGGLTASLTNGATYAAGLVGQAFSLDGVDDKITIPGSATSGPLVITGSEMAIEAWVYQTSSANPPGGYQVIFDKWSGSGGYLLATTNGGRLTSNIYTTSGSYGLAAPSALPLNTWVHVAVTFYNGTARLYQNGVQVASASIPGNIINQTDNASIGNDNNPSLTNSGWSGLIDELAVYARPVQGIELQAIYNAGAAGKAQLMGNSGQGINVENAPRNSIGGITSVPGTGAGNVISGNRFGTGIYLHGTGSLISYNTLIQGNLIGTDATGTKPIPNRYSGMYISDGVQDVTIGGTVAGAGNVISGNTYAGVVINPNETSVAGSKVLVAGNIIGLARDGNAVLGNTNEGVWNYNTFDNTIGGSTAAARNIISGNGGVGIQIGGNGVLTETSHNVLVTGNYIGTDITGLLDRGNGANGIGLWGQSYGNTIGGLTSTPGTGLGNVISGNDQFGVVMNPSNNNLVMGNIIGLDKDGLNALPNNYEGLTIDTGSGNTIGGTVAAARNIISANFGGWGGIGLRNAGTFNNLVVGNYIGTDITGFLDRGNAVYGIGVSAGAHDNTIGGSTAGARNVISGNDSAGIRIFDSTTTANLVAGNFIGLARDGVTALGNSAQGVLIISSASNNTIGGPTAGYGNVIGSNASHGILISGTGTTANVVTSNFSGTDLTGTIARPNLTAIRIEAGASGNTIGGLAATPGTAPGNLFAANTNNSVVIIDSATTGNLVIGNTMGLNSAGDVLSSNGAGVLISSATGNTIGGTVAGARNVLSGHVYGVNITGSTATANRVWGNYIGTDVTGFLARPNSSSGIFIQGGAAGNTIGGAHALTSTALGARNVIAGNTGTGILLNGGGSSNVIQGNYIGVDASGNTRLANGSIGLQLFSTNFTIIGTNGDGSNDDQEGNVISGSAGFANLFHESSSYTVIAGNIIGLGADGSTVIGGTNSGTHGIEIKVYSIGVRIGTNADGVSDAFERNIISGNRNHGIFMWAIGTENNLIAGNYIGTDITGTLDRGNSSSGILFTNGASGNTIGGVSPAARNVISGNDQRGIYTGESGDASPRAFNNLIIGNYIGTTASGNAPLGNSLEGVLIQNGGTNTVQNNVISGNGTDGVSITTTGVELYGFGDSARFDDGNTNPGRLQFGSVSNQSDLRVGFLTAYTDTYLFIAVQVQDQFIDANPADAATPWLNDSVELFIDPNRSDEWLGNGRVSSRKGMQLIADAAGNKYSNGSISTSSWDVVRKLFTGQAGQGYILEFRIPLSILDVNSGAGFTQAGPGSNLRFNIAVTDNDADVSAQQKYGLFWRDGNTTPVNNGEIAWAIDLFLDNRTTPNSNAPMLVSVPYRPTGMTLDGNIGSGAANNRVVGNTIGLGADGSTVIANGNRGVFVSGYGNTIGGTVGPVAPVASNLALWLNADQGVSVNSSGFVTGWTDQSGNNFNGTTVGSGVTLASNAVGGHSAVRFAGAGAVYNHRRRDRAAHRHGSARDPFELEWVKQHDVGVLGHGQQQPPACPTHRLHERPRGHRHNPESHEPVHPDGSEHFNRRVHIPEPAVDRSKRKPDLGAESHNNLFRWTAGHAERRVLERRYRGTARLQHRAQRRGTQGGLGLSGIKIPTPVAQRDLGQCDARHPHEWGERLRQPDRRQLHRH